MAFTMEPGMMIAKIISQDRSWNEVLTTSKGVVNGATAYLIGNKKVGHKYIDNFLPNIAGNDAYPNRLTNLVFKNAKPSNYKNFAEVETGGLKAGIMKTMAFHKVTNGHRAKANRIRQSLLCQEFTPPDEPQTESDEEDLSKRPYCSHCHKVLEPMTNFFSHWPDSDNFEYLKDISDIPDASDPKKPTCFRNL